MVVLTLKNKGAEAASNLEVEVAAQWQTGPLRNSAKATWESRAVLKKFRGITGGVATTQNLRVPGD